MTTMTITIICRRCNAQYSAPTHQQINQWQALHWRDCTNPGGDAA